MQSTGGDHEAISASVEVSEVATTAKQSLELPEGIQAKEEFRGDELIACKECGFQTSSADLDEQAVCKYCRWAAGEE
jgi:hypothetical protein